uniref:Uncharacterized protein n=1 Tax=Plectus sambesii TaxID=2011161 RepID=A0A914WT05_9BILA
MGNSKSSELEAYNNNVVHELSRENLNLQAALYASKQHADNMQEQIKFYGELIQNQANLFVSETRLFVSETRLFYFVLIGIISLLVVIATALICWQQKRADNAEKRHRAEKAEIEQKLLKAQENEREQRESEVRQRRIHEDMLRDEERRAESNNRRKLETLLSQAIQRLDDHIGHGGNQKKAALRGGALNRTRVELSENEESVEGRVDCAEANNFLSTSAVPRPSALSPD